MTRLIVVALLAMICSSTLLTAQECEPTIYEFPLEGAYYDSRVSMDNTLDNGKILAGSFSNPNNETGIDIAVWKTDQFGNEVWSQTIGWEGDEELMSIRQLADGNYIMLCNTTSPSLTALEKNILLIKIDENGNVLWTSILGTGTPVRYGASDLEILPDGGFVVVGYLFEGESYYEYYGPILMITVDPNGNVMNTNEVSPVVSTWSGTANTVSTGRDVFLTDDGGFIFSASSSPLTGYWPSDRFVTIIKTNANLEIIWQLVDLPNSCYPLVPKGGVEYDDGSLYITATSYYGGCVDGGGVLTRLIKLSAEGDIIWTKSPGPDFTGDVAIASDNNLVLSKGRGIIKVNPSGNTIWQSPLVIGNSSHNEYYSNVLKVSLQTSSFWHIFAQENHLLLVEFDSLGNNCTSIATGSVFIDNDQDCVKDSSESFLENAILELNPGNFYVNTNEQGAFRLQLDTGQYNLQLHPPNALWEVGCPLSITHDFSFSAPYQVRNNLDFGLHAVEECALLNLNLSFSRARVCTEQTITVRYCNEGTIAQTDAIVEVELDEVLEFQNATLPWTQMGNTYSFNVGDIAVGECDYFKITVFVDCDAELDSIVCVNARILPENSCTLEAGHDNDKECRPVVNSFDPNDKLAAAADTSSCWETALDELAFTIRFQNTGNDTAYHVVIVDTISSVLDLSTVRPGPSSHPYEFKVSGRDRLMFVFQDIDLLDSTSNPAASQGFVQFFIHSKTNIAQGTVIENQAAIYFDSNDPIFTPPVQLPQCSDIPLTVVDVMPTPVANCLSPDGTLQITVSGGDGTYEYSIDDGESWQSSSTFSALSDGTYNIKVKDETGLEVDYFRNPVMIEKSIPIFVDVLVTDNDSCGGSDGVLEIQAHSLGEKFYSIDGGITYQEEPMFEGLAAGTYQLIAQNGCQEGDTTHITIADPSLPEFTNVSWGHPDCNADNGSIRAYAIGESSRYYSIDGGVTWQSQYQFWNLPAGEYQVMASYGNGNCAITYESTITLVTNIIEPHIQEVITTPASQCGGQDASLEVISESQFLQYSVDGGTSFQGAPLFENLSSGNYMVIVRNHCNVEDTLSSVVIPEPASPEITNVETQNPECGESNGSIMLQTTGHFPRRVSLDGGITWNYGQEFQQLPPGEYQIMVSYVNGSCPIPYDSLIILEDQTTDPTIQQVISTAPSQCDVIDGSLEVFTTSSLLEYSIDGGISFQMNPVFEGLTSGSYMVISQNECGMQDTLSSIIIDTLPIPEITGTQTITPGCGQSNGAIFWSATGGENLEFSINGWTEILSDTIITGLAGGNYILRARNEFNCYAENELIVLTALPPPVLDELVLNPPDCENESGDIRILAHGEEPLLYSIDGGTNWQESILFTGLTVGHYNAMVGNLALTCFDGPQGVIFNYPDFPDLENVNFIAPSASTATDGSIEILTSESEPLLYSIDQGGTWQSSGLFTNLPEGTYYPWISWADNTCIVMGDSIVLTAPTGTLDFTDANIQSLTLFPNPAREKVQLNMELKKPAEVKWDITTVTGEKIWLNGIIPSSTQPQASIPIEKLPAGVYVVHIHMNGQEYARKLVVY